MSYTDYYFDYYIDTWNYIFSAKKKHNNYYLFRDERSDKANRVESYDRALHQSLDEIFHECCLRSSRQIKDFLRSSQQDTDSIIKLESLEQEPFICGNFSKRELSKISLLWIAVLAGYTESAELLVRSGADVDELFGRHDPQLIDEKSSVLHVLLRTDPYPENEQLIRLVVDHSADLEAREVGGRTALHIAVQQHRIQLAERLLEKGADLQARDSRGETALHIAARSGRVQMTEMLLEKGAEVNCTDGNGVTPLLAAAGSSEAAELVPLLMKHGADVFAKDKYGESVLHMLAYGSDKRHLAGDLAKVLIEKGCSLNDGDHHFHKFQPIHTATLNGNNELINIYLDHGANVNSMVNGGSSPLHLAVIQNDSEVLETLLKRGANVDLIDNSEFHKGRTALHEACDRSNYESIKVLVSAGANVLAEDDDGMTPFALLGAYNANMERLTSSRLIVKKLALEKIRQPSIELKDERNIERYPKLWDYYRECIKRTERMKSTRFIETCTFFELLTKCHCKIAALMRNPEFETEFKRYDLERSGFSTYAEVSRSSRVPCLKI